MFILVNPKTKVLVKITEDCTPVTHTDGGVRVDCADEVAMGYFIESENTIYPKNLPVQMYEVKEIPEGVAPQKFIYTVENGFEENPDYVDPKPMDQDQIAQNAADIEYLAMMLDIEL